MSAMKSQEASSSASPCSYHVFLSFRGEDTRKTFTDHLYTALDQAGFCTFRDNDGLEKGEDIKSELDRAIRESRISIIIFSKNYAMSTWCLEELVIILKRKALGHLVLLVFYDVDPSEVTKQISSFKEAFVRYEERLKSETCELAKEKLKDKVGTWRVALTEIADAAGMNLQNQVDGFTSWLASLIYLSSLAIAVVVRDIQLWLEDGPSNVGIVAISGMGGIGKTTTTTTYLYNLNISRFECSSFITDGTSEIEALKLDICLLKKDVCTSMVFGDNRKRRYEEFLEKPLLNLGGTLKRYGFGIFSSHLEPTDPVNSNSVDLEADAFARMHKLKLLQLNRIRISGPYKKFSKGLRWLCWCGFPLKSIPNDFPLESLVALDMQYSRLKNVWGGNKFLGLLKILNLSYSYNLAKTPNVSELPNLEKMVLKSCTSLVEVHESIGRLKRLVLLDLARKVKLNNIANGTAMIKDAICGKKVFVVLDDVDTRDQLDALLGMRGDKESTVTILDGCEFYTVVGIQNLVDRCLISFDKSNTLGPSEIEGLKLDMCLLKEEAYDCPIFGGNRKRSYEEFLGKPLLSNLGGSLERYCFSIFSSHLEPTIPENSNLEALEADAFTGMNKLKLLQLNRVHISGPYKKFPKGLRWLCWREFPLKSIPGDFPLESLVALDMQYSRLKNVWDGTKADGIALYQSVPTNGWVNEVQSFIWPWRLMPRESPEISWPSLPQSLVKSSLAERNLSDDDFPRDLGNLCSLKELNLSSNQFLSLPDFVRGLPKLEKLAIQSCPKLRQLYDVPQRPYLNFGDNRLLEELTFQISHRPTTHCHLDTCNHPETLGFFKLKSIGNVEAEIINNLGLSNLESTGNQTVCYETHIYAYIPGNKVPPWFNFKNLGSSIDFIVPSYLNLRIRGLNVCLVYEHAGDPIDYQVLSILTDQKHHEPHTVISNRTKGLIWSHCPQVFGTSEDGEDTMWLSYWKFGNHLESGDEVNISVSGGGFV
ncbi:hypothetical protein RHMOL_Rhmol05G0221900 [Rhododendron molle]|uniref:Uncharacterized protein n=1 Tax=Rhododendron molle TaxID=49168 RepID=A0ACC0NRN0_RHOML|nr:hypothetical protein RHMOL_Rhmol05G0221900 [Rhododendron molle]